uniref:Uncharacterized protein n=1 Tax=Vitis vinifera TaxID=29760 RepID=A5AGQ7_VITVI|nr:hypothetical protein VITISV_016674 [Vitis vinifera]
MAKTRGAKTPSPSAHSKAQRASPVRDSLTEPPQPPAIPPFEHGVPFSPPQRRYQTRRPPTTLGRYHLEHLMTPRDFFYPRVALDFYQSMTTHRVRDPTVIHFTIDERHGILGAKHIAEAPRIPYEPRRGAILEALFRISKGFYFGPHHLIMTTLLYFEEKVHRKKLLRVDAIPLLFPRLLCQILEHLGYPSEPQLERRRISQEIFTLDKWTSMTAYVAQPGAPAGPKVQRPMSYFADIDHYSERPCTVDGSQPTDPSQDAPLVEQTVPHEEMTTGDIETPILSTQTSTTKCLGIKIHSQKSGVKSEELVVERSLKLDALNLDWLGVIIGSLLHGNLEKKTLKPCTPTMKKIVNQERMSGQAFRLLELRKLGKVSNAKIRSFVVSAFNEEKLCSRGEAQYVKVILQLANLELNVRKWIPSCEINLRDFRNFLSSQSNSQDFSSEDERLSSLSLGVKKAGCACHIEYEIAEEAMNFLSYVAELSRGWDEPNARDMGRMTSQPNAKAEMYILKEKIDMKAKIAAMARRLEELEMKKMQEMQAISQTPLQAMPCAICLSYEHLVEECPTIPVVREMFGDCNTYNSNWRDHPNFSWKPQPPQYQQPAQAPQKLGRAERKFRKPQSKVRKFSHRAKHPPGTRVAFRTTQTNFCTVRIKVRNSIQHAKITVQGANSLNVSFAHHYSRCETPFWHTSAITLSIEMVSHRVKQGAKISHSVKLSAKLDSWCETTCKIFFFNESTSKSGETCETTSEKVNQLVKIHPSFENPKSKFAWLLFKMRKISHSAKPPAATRVSSPQVAKRFCTVRNKVRKILHYANSSAKIKTWCENFAP